MEADEVFVDGSLHCPESERVSPQRPRRQPASSTAAPFRRALPAPSPPKGRSRAPQPLSELFTDVPVERPTTAPAFSPKPYRALRAPPQLPEPEEVIDLGAPRTLRAALGARARATLPALRRASYVPNPRLYPGPERAKPRPPARQVDSRAGGEGRVRRRKRAPRRVVPNPRLYTPAPPAPRRPPPPPLRPRAVWAPPAPASRLDTASRAALHLSERRGQRSAPPPPLVVTLPPGAAAAPPRYRPASAHFRLRSLDTESGESTPVAARVLRPAAPPAMAASSGKPTLAPEDCSDGNETLSAPSEFLAEFLSAIMRRQYAEALKYCRLILQYEPHNATARGFYPLLQQKVRAQRIPEMGCPHGSSSEEHSVPSASSPGLTSHSDKHDTMDQGGDSSERSEAAGGAGWRSGDSCRSQSSLELDSSSASSRSPSPSPPSPPSPPAAWDSAGSASRSDTDDNGNATSAPAPPPPLCAGDLANDNAPADKGEASVLQRLRAQFACSIK